MNLIVDFIGHFAYLLAVIGTVYVSKKDKNGFLARVISDSIWFVIGLYLNLSSIFLWSIVFLIVDIRAYKKWVDDSKPDDIISKKLN